MKPFETDLLVIGGGASGLMAALAAAEQGYRIDILERMNRVGKKLLVTGNSRCNLTNLNLSPSHYHGARESFVRTVLNNFNVEKTLHFFQNLGLAWKSDQEKRIYPVSEQASSVLDILRFKLDSYPHVHTRCSAEVAALQFQAPFFTASLKNHQQFKARKVILSSGGQAMKDLGSNGSGYRLAKSLNHQIITPFPALTKLHLDSPYLKGLKGVRFDGTVTLVTDQPKAFAWTGELLFTEDGLSGIPALQSSRHVTELMSTGKHLEIELDLLPAYPHDALIKDLTHRFQHLSHLTMEKVLLTILKKRMILPVLKTAQISHQRSASSLKPQETEQLVTVMKHWIFPVKGTKAWNEAQVTAGGVNTEEINPRTMESRLVPGLYFSGEIVDVDGDCGGYNLQWAWSSGYTAGISAASSLS
jgi:predicted Rossmann fold flavoprotein